MNADGSFTGVAAGLDRPTSMQIIGTTTCIVTLTGEILTGEHRWPPCGQP